MLVPFVWFVPKLSLGRHHTIPSEKNLLGIITNQVFIHQLASKPSTL